MGRTSSRKRPWLAALLAVAVTGLGHLYLRRWKRAVGWILSMFAVSVLFVDQTALAAVTTGRADPTAVAPLLIVGGVSVVDAYVLARAQNAVVRVTPNREGARTHCPGCGEELDGDLDFCHWCSTELPTEADGDG
jgi:hypothetical protein